MTSLAQYDNVRAALAEAREVEDVRPLLDEFELAKLRAKQIDDHEMLADATELEMRAKRRLGEILAAAKKAGLFKQGRQPKKAKDGDLSERPTLADAQIDPHLSQRAQKLAVMPELDFENKVDRTRERIVSDGAKLIDSDLPNGARAIMGSREESLESLDYFPTPPWATRALLEYLRGHLLLKHAWEPACGEGHMAEVLREYFKKVIVSDVHDYGYRGTIIKDFLKYDGPGADWIVTNPPFHKKTEAFVLRAIELATVGVAMFVRLQWLESNGRYENIFLPHPPTQICFFAERVPLCKGEWKPDNATATAYIWLLWIKGVEPKPPFWIPPGQRERLTKPDDAARFTSHPVIRKEDYEARIGDESGTNQQPDGTDALAPAAVSEPASATTQQHQCPAGAGSP